MEGRISKPLAEKITSIDLSHPYIWKLRLSEADFNEIEVCLKTIVTTQGISALATTKNAITTIVYIAEWYKRKYQSGNKIDWIENLDLETLWINAGINQKSYLYRDDNGDKRWLYSIYVLGGLAIQHELNRNDKMKFLKGLCRIYHGEDYTIENLDEASRAVAFRESIKRQHSLYEYLKEILNGEMPFHQDDLSEETSDVNRFVATVKAANDEILRVKFRMEWAVTFSPDYTNMIRRLNIWFKPEEVGGELHQYLRYDRVHLWGVPNPEKQLHLYIYIRFKNGDKVVEPSSIDKPIITYLNHSVNDFVAFGVERGVQIKNIPTQRFDKIEIIAKDDAGNEYLVQVQKTTEYIQLWRQGDYGDTWTSTQNAQKETSLLFSNHCRLKDETILNDVYHKCFRDPKYGTSTSWNWIYIYDFITFYDEKGKEFTLYNRIGYDQVTTRLYTNTIHYVGGGKIKHFYIDDPEISENYDVDELPLIFGWQDIVVRHFATKDDILNAQPEEETVAENIKYKQENGRYAEWSLINEPPYGKLTLKITVKGKPVLFSVIYLPKLKDDYPIKRDYESMAIRYKAIDNSESIIQDKIMMDGKVLYPTIPIRYGNGSSYYEVNVYRPTLIKEVMLDGKIIEYLEGDEKLQLPYIFKNRVQLNDFSKNGYQAYECKNLKSIYTQNFINIAGNPSIGEAAMNAWRMDNHYAGKLLDTSAPDSLVVCFGNTQKNSSWEEKQAFFWSYDENVEPEIIDPINGADTKDVGIIFQDISNTYDLCCNLAMDIDNDPWAWDDIKENILKCFEVANHYGTYFFLMKPLRGLVKTQIIPELYQPLYDSRNGNLTPEDKQGLLRFAEELGFDWQEFNINFDNE